LCRLRKNSCRTPSLGLINHSANSVGKGTGSGQRKWGHGYIVV
jgi:hypothetical protein